MNTRLRMMENFSRAAARYDTRAHFQHTETARVLDSGLMIFPHDARVLDIGCGTGYFAEMARGNRPGWRITGVDMSPGMCAIAARRCTAIQADATNLPLKNASYDAVVSSLCLQWVEDLPLAFAEIARVLRPGGRAVIASLGNQSLPELREVAKGAELPLGLLPMRAAADYQVAIAASGLGSMMFKQNIGTDYYKDMFALLDSMREVGAGNPAGSGGLQGVRRWKTMQSLYERKRTAKGIPATWDRLFMVLHKPL